MTVEKIKYKGFRNIAEQELKLDPGVNILYGENAQGKTNALEGIYLFAHGKSFRTQNDRDMVAFDAHKTTLDMVFEDDLRKRELSFELFKTKRRACKINKAPARLSDIIGLFRAVLFCPDHLSIVKDGPAHRRSFVNGAICQLKPVYLRSLQRYNHILEQRNALLKQADGNIDKYKDVIDIYSLELAREAAYIYTVRREYISSLERHVKVFFEEMSRGEAISLKYKNSLKDYSGDDISEISEKYYELFCRDIDKEMLLKTTLHGVHRDDIEIYLSDKEARLYASQGQQRSIALALKLAEGEISKEESGKYPVFLFDDVLSELDRGRQKFVLDKLSDRQVIITSCDISGFSSEMLENSNLIEVENGIYKTKKG
jgi:DNA replication and repair protein RecF